MSKFVFTVIILVTFVLSACSPKVGSEVWCKALNARDKGDWTANEAANYTKYFVLKFRSKG